MIVALVETREPTRGFLGWGAVCSWFLHDRRLAEIVPSSSAACFPDDVDWTSVHHDNAHFLSVLGLDSLLDLAAEATERKLSDREFLHMTATVAGFALASGRDNVRVIFYHC